MPSEPMELAFPVKGIDENWAYGKQPEGTSPDTLNVVPYDAISNRLRGGQRWGLSKYYADQHNGSAALQRFASISTYHTSTTLTDSFTQSDNPLSSASWYCFRYAAPNYIISTTLPKVVSNKIQTDNTDSTFDKGAIHKFADIGTSNYTLSAKVTITLNEDGGQVIISLIARGATTFPVASASIGVEGYVRITRISSSNYELYVNVGGSGIAPITMTLGSGDYLDPTWWNTERTIQLIVTGNTFKLYAEATLLHTGTTSSFSLNTGVGFRIRSGAYNVIGTIDDFSFSNIIESNRDYKLIAISGGDVFAGRPSESLIASTNGTNALVTSGRVDAQSAFEKVYFVDGNPAHYKLLTLSTNTVSVWTPTAGTLPVDSNQTYYTVTGVSQGSKTFTIAENLSALVANDYIQINGSTGNDGYYTVVSVSGTGPTVITVNQSIPDATVDGQLRYVNYACNIVRLYRGRIIMSGLPTDPHNWFMSAADSPLDWNYGATPSATMAVAGNNTNAGKCPDIITCLAPYSDDLMYIGGDHSLWVMRGDPAGDGRIDNISYQTGIAGPDAYTFDENGIFYFMGMNRIVYRLTPGNVPEPLSVNRLDETFRAINLTTHKVHLQWDNARHGLHIFVIPSTAGTTTHYWWDQRTDGFWPIRYPNNYSPATVYAFDGDNPDDNALLLGGWDGYIRMLDSSVKKDDDTTISSYVEYTPITLAGPDQNMILNRIVAVLDDSSDAVGLTVYSDETPQKAISSSTIRFAKSLSAGRNVMISRIAGNTFVFKLSNSTSNKTWAIETILVSLMPRGRVRKGLL